MKKWNLTIYPNWHFYFKRKLFSLQGVCVSRQRVCVCEYVWFLQGVNRNLFRRFSISAGVAQREWKIRLPAARYYLLPLPIYHSFSGRGGSAARFRLTTVHLWEPQSSVFLPQLKALPVSHCFSHSDVASEASVHLFSPWSNRQSLHRQQRPLIPTLAAAFHFQTIARRLLRCPLCFISSQVLPTAANSYHFLVIIVKRPSVHNKWLISRKYLYFSLFTTFFLCLPNSRKLAHGVLQDHNTIMV